MIAKVVKKYRMDDPQQEIDDLNFWADQTDEFKIETMEILRQRWIKMQGDYDTNPAYQGLRGVLVITKRKAG